MLAVLSTSKGINLYGVNLVSNECDISICRDKRKGFKDYFLDTCNMIQKERKIRDGGLHDQVIKGTIFLKS